MRKTLLLAALALTAALPTAAPEALTPFDAAKVAAAAPVREP